MKLKIFYIVLVFVLLLLLFCIFFTNNRKNDFPYLKIFNAIIKVEIADTTGKQYLGLSNRPNLCSDCGMVFVFEDKIIRHFVMRNMNFPLDIIWIDGDVVVGIEKNLDPEGAMPKNVYSSDEAVDYVLEVNGGFCDSNNIKIGDKVKFKNF